MREQILRFMQDSPEAKTQTFANNPFGAFVRNDIPEALYATGLVDREKYLIEGSAGKGNWALVPWICIFDKAITTSATRGVYIVYLLSKDSKRLYLTFNQGCTEISNSHGKRETIKIMRDNANEIVGYTDAHGFGVGDEINLGEGLTSLGQYYERGTIYYKRYDIDDVPNEEELRQDLASMMEIYRQYAQHQNNDDWWPPLSEYDPGISKEKWLELLNDPAVFEASWLSVLAKFYDIGGTASCKQIASQYGGQAQSYNMTSTAIARKVHQVTNCPLIARPDGGYNYFTVLFMGRNAQRCEEGSYIWKMRSELYQALSEIDIGKYIKRIGVFDSWTIVDELTAVKKCDKSFFDYNGSGVPKGICWFFEAEYLELGQVIRFEVLYQGQTFDLRIQNESSDRRRVRLFWSAELGKLLAPYKDLEGAKATFQRVGDHTFELTMKGDETEMTVREKMATIQAYIEAKGFTYGRGLIENFYLSLKSKPFVILAGTSGTGKTRLVRLFAEAIGATKENGRYEQVAVRPDWSDSTDLFGHVDLNGKFIPGKILEFLWKAGQEKNKPYILCLDEMNLARVEYYLSDFLSVIETRDMKDGEIITDALVSEEDYGPDDKARDKYGVIRFPENLYIVGTVNMDETTFPFSKKVLDRANTIEFNYVDLNTTWQDAVENVEPLDEDNTFLRSNYLKLIECPEKEYPNVSGISAKLENLNQILQKANAHVGYRVRDEIAFYLLNNLESGVLNEDVAMDNEIMQKILPRIQGSSGSIKKMLCELFRELAGDFDQSESNNTADRMMDVLRASTHVRYPKSAEKIAFMVRRFEEDGFTSYWL